MGKFLGFLLFLQALNVAAFCNQPIRHSQQVAQRHRTLFQTDRAGKILRQKHRHQNMSSRQDGDFLSETKILCDDQTKLAKIYRGSFMLYCAQVVLAIKKSGLTLASLNSIGAPLMGAGITHILDTSSKRQLLGLDTFKRLNGLMFLYAIICLSLLALVPQQLKSPFGILWLLTGSSSILLGTKGYLSGLRADGGKPFLSETYRLFEAASKLSVSLPPKDISYANFFRLSNIAIRKIIFVWGALRAIFDGGGTIALRLAPKVSQLARFTLLGGSLVTVVSAKDDPVARKLTAGFVNAMALFVFSSISALTLVGASSTLAVVDGLMLLGCAFVSASEGLYETRRQSLAPKENSD